MDPEETRAWMKSRSPLTQRTVKGAMLIFLAALGLVCVQVLIWFAAGWGSVNFLPGLVVVAIYIFAIGVGLVCAYHMVSVSVRFLGRSQWGAALMIGVMATGVVAGALAHSLPQLSTLVISAPVTVEREVHASRIRPSLTNGPRGRACSNQALFGPFLFFRGGWCGVRLSAGEVYTLEGRGNWLAARVFEARR